MNGRLIFGGIMLASLLAAPVQAQIHATNDCGGQPVLTGDQGSSVTVNAFPAGTTFTDSIDTTSGNGCAPGRNQPDSVVCFTPSKACTVAARIDIGSEVGSINLFNKCSSKPTNCLDDSTSTGTIGVEEFLIPNVEACIVVSGFGPPTNASLIIEKLDTCGTLKGSSQPSLSASYKYSPTFPKADAKVEFTDTSSGSPTGWSWDFGDGSKSTSTQQNPSHTYSSAGSYTVKLTVSKDSEQSSTQKNVVVKAASTGPALDKIYFVPSAAHATGAASSFWVTDMDVNNSGSNSATFKIVWLPRNKDNRDPTESQSYTLAAGAVQRFQDVVKSVFGLDKGAGAVAVISNSSQLKIQSRTYNLTDNGTMGVGIPAVAEFDLNPAQTRMRLLFITENSAFRSNFAFQNGTDLPLTVKWERFKSDGSKIDTGNVDLKPWGNTQINQLFKDQAPIDAAYMDVWTETRGGKFVVFATVVDNKTNDGSVVQPQW